MMTAFLTWLRKFLRDAFPVAEDEHSSPYEYVEVETADLQLNDYLPYCDGYIQRISEEDVYTGERSFTTKRGHEPSNKQFAQEGERFIVRRLRSN